MAVHQTPAENTRVHKANRWIRIRNPLENRKISNYEAAPINSIGPSVAMFFGVSAGGNRTGRLPLTGLRREVSNQKDDTLLA